MKKLLSFILIFISFIGIVNATSNYYYKGDDGAYYLCDGNKCFPVNIGESNTIFDLNKGMINYQGTLYYYNSAKEKEYQQTTYGKTRMYFYYNGSRYVLCDDDNNCHSYTIDQLTNKGAIMYSSEIRIPSNVAPGAYQSYYLNSSKSSVPSGENNSGTNSSNVSLDESPSCKKLKEPLMFIGRIVNVIKILIPIILIGLGMLDLFKAVTGPKEDEIKTSTRRFALRLVAAIAIFFLPTIVSVAFNLVDSWRSVKTEFNACAKCILNVKECE